MPTLPAAEAVTRLSNTDLAKIEDLLRKQQAQRRAQLADLAAAELTVPRTTDAEIADVLVQGSREALEQIHLALDRLRVGRYGRCLDCGAAIGRERLYALPAAARCTTCQGRAAGGRGTALLGPHRASPARRVPRTGSRVVTTP